MKTKNIAIIGVILMSLFTTSCMSSHDTAMIQPTDLGFTTGQHVNTQPTQLHHSQSPKPVYEM
jgi:hypothetical protein